MKTSDNKGIICDKCGMSIIDEFTYYSFDVRIVRIFNNSKREIDDILTEPINYSKDICEGCGQSIFDTVIKINAKETKATRQRRNYDFCEITGRHLTGNYIYNYITVDKVSVVVAKRIVKADKRFIEFRCVPEELPMLFSSTNNSWSTKT